MDILRQVLNRFSSISLATFCLAGAALVLTSCSDDDPEPFRPQLPAAGGKAVRSIQHLGSLMTSYDWTFAYSGDRLVSADGKVRDSDATIDGSFSYTSWISYGPASVSVSNSSGEKTTVRLNSMNYIDEMEVNRNRYKFYYTDGRLSGWQKTVFENSFGQAMQYRSSATIEYLNGNLSRIVYTETDNDPVTLTFTPSGYVNRNGLLPETVSKEMGCLSFEHLYYAGLLGRSTTHLVKSINVTSQTRNYTTEFEYSQRGNDIVLCTYHTPQGGVSSVSYGY